MTPLIEACNVTRVFLKGLLSKQRLVALEDFSMIITGETPSITAVVGESGSGKTTLARLLLGLLPPTRGEVLYKGRDLRTLSRREWQQFRQDVQVIFQDPFDVYNPFYKVDHVLTTPIARFGLSRSAREVPRLIEEALTAVGLRPEETLGRYPHQLSGGQRQRIMVARTLLIRPKLIIADEPVSMVDASLRATILASLGTLKRDFGISILYITHDLTTAFQISENILVMYRGSVVEAGDVNLVVQDPQHPYTRLLVGSVPQPDPDLRWGGQESPSPVALQADPDRGCKFAGRCPHAREECLANPPLLYQTAPHRVAACYLYEDAPAISREQMSGAFAPAPPWNEKGAGAGRPPPAGVTEKGPTGAGPFP